MKKMRKFVLLTAASMLLPVIIYNTVFAQVITREQLQNTENIDVLREIGESVARDTKNETLPESEIPGRIEVYMENVLGDDEKEAIISVFYGPKYNITAVYKEENGGYEYVGELGTFFNPKDVKVKNFNKGNPIVFVSDYINQQAGAFEESVYFYGYTWNDEKDEFINVFLEPMNIDAQWLENGVWQKAERKGKAVYENSSVPNIKTEYNQFYYTAEDDGTKSKPEDDEYTLVEEWTENELFYWSDRWQRFIVGEAVEKSTGDKVAVISRWEKLPYTRAPEFAGYENYVRIVRSDGSMEVVPEGNLGNVEVKKESTMENV